MTAQDVDTLRCPVCNEPATLDIHRAYRKDEGTGEMVAWDVQLYRCPNMLLDRKKTNRWGVPKKQKPGQHKAYKIETRVGDTMPVITAETRDQLQAARTTLGLKMSEVAEMAGIPKGSLTGILSGAQCSDDRMANIERVTKRLSKKAGLSSSGQQVEKSSNDQPVATNGCPANERGEDFQDPRPRGFPAGDRQPTWPPSGCTRSAHDDQVSFDAGLDVWRCHPDLNCQRCLRTSIDRTDSAFFMSPEMFRYRLASGTLCRAQIAAYRTYHDVPTDVPSSDEAPAGESILPEAPPAGVEPDLEVVDGRMEDLADQVALLQRNVLTMAEDHGDLHCGLHQVDQRLQLLEQQHPLVRLEPLPPHDALDDATAALRRVPASQRLAVLKLVEAQEQVEELQAQLRQQIAQAAQ